MTSGAGGSDAGEPGTTTGGGSGEAGSTTSGAAGSALGGSGGRGGAGAAGAGGSAGGGAGNGGSGGAGGTTAGDAGAAGAPDLGCLGEYNVCGCGCCGEPTDFACYYPERGDDLAAIVQDDQATRASPSCQGVACKDGVRRVCCETSEVEEDATYTATGWSSDEQYIALVRESSDGRCTRLTIYRAFRDVPSFALELDNTFAFDSANDGACGENGSIPARDPIGALGFFNTATPGRCYLDFDFTLFFLTEERTVDAVRFKGEDLTLAGCAP
jgi:hypothetical protein